MFNLYECIRIRAKQTHPPRDLTENLYWYQYEKRDSCSYFLNNSILNLKAYFLNTIQTK